MVAAVDAEMVAGFPSGRLFLDSIEQAMAVALVNGHAVRHRPVQIYRGGLGSARLRRIKELVHAKMENDLSLDEMADASVLQLMETSSINQKLPTLPPSYSAMFLEKTKPQSVWC
jgi:AraC family transcriptional regulator